MKISAKKLREELHQFIDSSDTAKLKAFYTLFENEIYSIKYNEQYTLTKEQLEENENRVQEIITGKSKSYTWEEAKKIIVSK